MAAQEINAICKTCKYKIKEKRKEAFGNKILSVITCGNKLSIFYDSIVEETSTYCNKYKKL